jgi:creatinine amidohydrolase
MTRREVITTGVAAAASAGGQRRPESNAGAPSRYDMVRYELLRPEEVLAARERAPIAYIVAGSIEWHGHQLPLGTDGLKAHAICCEAALTHGGVVLPTVSVGMVGGWGPQGWANYGMGLSDQAAFDAVMLALARGLVAGGWKVIVGVTGHDVREHVESMRKAIESATAGKGARGFACMEGEMWRPGGDIPFGMDHAGAWETSAMMHAHPGRVDLDALRRRGLAKTDDLRMDGPEGIGGRSPLKFASAEIGKRIVERMGDLIGAKAKGMLT